MQMRHRVDTDSSPSVTLTPNASHHRCQKSAARSLGAGSFASGCGGALELAGSALTPNRKGPSRGPFLLSRHNTSTTQRPRAHNPMNPIREFHIIDSTLREGEQFALAYFTQEQKLTIAAALDAFGVDYMELSSPV